MQHVRLQEDVPRQVRDEPQVELAVVQREDAADGDEVGAAQRVPLQLGHERRERRLEQLHAPRRRVVRRVRRAGRELAEATLLDPQVELLPVVLAAEPLGRPRQQKKNIVRARQPVALLSLHLSRPEAVLLQRGEQLGQRRIHVCQLLLTEDPHRLEEALRLRRAVR